MTIRPRTCAHCASFSPAPAVGEPTCWDLVLITERAGTATELRRAPVASDFCSSHLTHTEDRQETERIEQELEKGGMEQAMQAASSIFIARSVVRQAMQ